MKPNKIVLILGMTGILALIGIVTVLFVKGREQNNMIDRMTAQNLALADAGVEEADVTFTKEKLEKEDGRAFYDLAFYSADYKYVYEIDAATGIVIGMDIEVLAQMPGMAAPGNAGQENSLTEADGIQTPPGQISESSQQDSPQNSPQNNQPDDHISLAQAKEYALSDAGLQESEVTFVKEKLEREDGIWVYDLTFYTATGEYDYEINAATGAVIDREMEVFQNASGQTTDALTAQSGIDAEQAKNIAVSHVGFSVSEVTFSKAELDYENNVAVYEIEFYKGRMEYEYEIDAASGNILEYKSEYRD